MSKTPLSRDWTKSNENGFWDLPCRIRYSLTRSVPFFIFQKNSFRFLLRKIVFFEGIKLNRFKGKKIKAHPIYHQVQVLNQCLPKYQTTTENSNWIHIWETKNYRVLKYLLYTCHFDVFYIFYIIPPHPFYTARRKYKRSNVLYVVTQGHYVILPITSIFREY